MERLCPIASPCKSALTAGIEGRAAFLKLPDQALQTAPQRWAGATFGSLLQLMGEGSDQQIATEARRWSGAMQ